MSIFSKKNPQPKPQDLTPGKYNCPFNLQVAKDDVANRPNFLGSTDIAKGVDKVAELIAENFPNDKIDYMVEAKTLSPDAAPDALPVHFLFYKDGQPKAAVVLVSTNGIKSPRVIKTKMLCDRLGINYIRIYANGNFGDWITGIRNGGPTPKNIIEFCKDYNVQRIREALV